MKYLSLSLLAVLIMTGCSTLIDGQTQNLTIKTPGAENARCLVYNQDMKYAIYTDQTVEIMKSPNDLVINCKAAGNRERTVLLKREINEWVLGNVVNGFVPGAAYDYFSRGGFEYPPVIEVSFAGEQVKRYPLPQYMTDDLRNNHQYGTIEHMGLGTMITEGNKHDQPATLEKRSNTYSAPTPAPYVAPKRAYDPTEEDK